jgi:tetratricopeptide (TPR) repeat protein
MHLRPLRFEDFPTVTDVTRTLTRRGGEKWPRTQRLRSQLGDNPDIANQYAPLFDPEESASVLHNLPTPDFDDTGFMGRAVQVEDLIKALRGPYPVITVLGTGGVGKTAIALNAAYEIATLPACPFDAIIWTTAKTSRLTQTDISEIHGSITTSIGIAQAALDVFNEKADSEPFSQVLELLGEFKILLVIDNLETILDDRIRAFVRDIPSGSKVLFTTRIGLGAYDFTVPIKEFPIREAEAYFRRVASVWKQDTLVGSGQEAIRGYCTRLNYSPLGIKWFVQAVASGVPPQRILSEPRDFLRFCLANVVDKLSRGASTILDVLVITSREQSPASLHFLSELPAVDVQEGLRELFASNLVNIITGKFGEEDRYQVSPLALAYLSRYHRSTQAFQESVRRRQGTLLKARQTAELEPEGTFSYDPNVIFVRKDYADTDAVAANYLRRALFHVKNDDFESAFLEIEKAKALAPTYFEIYRVEAFAATQSGNLLRAQTAYEEATALRQDYPPLRALYATFLMRSLSDSNGALAQIEHARRVDPEAIVLKVEEARAKMYLMEFAEARSRLLAVDISLSNNVRLTRMYHDTLVQAFARDLEKEYRSRNYQKFAKTFGDFVAYLNTILPHVVDGKMLRHFETVSELAGRVVEWEGVSPSGIEVAESLAFLDMILESHNRPTLRDISKAERQKTYLGTVCHLPIGENYGFLESDSGARLFFHRNSFSEPGDFLKLSAGALVEFEMGENNQGICAIDLGILRVPDA